MDFHISGNYHHHGDNIEKGGKKIVYNGDNPDLHPLTEEELKRKVDIVLPCIKSARMWFSVCKYMMWRHMCAEMNFKDACDILIHLYPELKLDYTKLRDLNVFSLKEELDDWKYEYDKPFKEEDIFEQYKFVATKMYEV